MRAPIAVLLVTLSSSAVSVSSSSPGLARPPEPPLAGDAARGFVSGANHHRGDTSFLQAFGRAPSDADPEPLRMRTHLVAVRAWLAARPPTRPELAARRAELLGYLDDYIAKGTTPQNADIAWRNPVFVDQVGNVCAVGYLIERSFGSAGRALVERIADAHRFDYLEDIDMPEVVAWVASSGFTLEELASIQPGYEAPIIETWGQWDLRGHRPDDGGWRLELGGTTTRGAWLDGQMTGPWVRTDADGDVIGQGEMKGGKGTWTSFDPRGRKLAEGPFAKSQPNGAWRFFHPSGRLAAEGKMRDGMRVGPWTFYYDADGAVPIAKGAFAKGGRVTGTWQHFDAGGELAAKTWSESEEWNLVLRMRSERDGLVHEIAEGNFGGDYNRVDMLERDGLRIFQAISWDDVPMAFDVDGRQLVRFDGVWMRGSTAWSEPELARAARRGRLPALRTELMMRRDEALEPAQTTRVAADVAAKLDALVAAAELDRAPTPSFVRDLARAEGMDAFDEAEHDTVPQEDARVTDLTRLVAASMTWYIEWPHVDGAFARVFATLPGHYAPDVLPMVEEGGAVSRDCETEDWCERVRVKSDAGAAVSFLQ